MKVPPAIWWVLIPTLITAIMPVIAQFYPTNEFFWSALIVAIGGAVVAAIQVWRDMQKEAPVGVPKPSAMAQASSSGAGDFAADEDTEYTYVTGPTGSTVTREVKPKKSFATRWLVG